MNFSNPKKLILLGASTGGPGLIESIIRELSKSFDFSFIIAQHMDTLPLKSFAKRLDRILDLKKSVILVDSDVSVDSGLVYVLSETSKLFMKNSVLHIKPIGEDSFYHPCIDTLFSSASSLKNIDIEAYLLSGIGSDGAEGLKELKKSGFLTIAQDENSSIVYGMPRTAVEIGAACRVCSIDEIVRRITGGF